MGWSCSSWGVMEEGRQQVQTQGLLLPEDKVSAVDLPPAAAVLEDASVAHHRALLKLGPVVGHILGEAQAQLSEPRSPLPSSGALTSATTSTSVDS